MGTRSPRPLPGRPQLAIYYLIEIRHWSPESSRSNRHRRGPGPRSPCENPDAERIVASIHRQGHSASDVRHQVVPDSARVSLINRVSDLYVPHGARAKCQSFCSFQARSDKILGTAGRDAVCCKSSRTSRTYHYSSAQLSPRPMNRPPS